MGYEADFLPADKHECLLQVDSIVPQVYSITLGVGSQP